MEAELVTVIVVKFVLSPALGLQMESSIFAPIWHIYTGIFQVFINYSVLIVPFIATNDIDCLHIVYLQSQHSILQILIILNNKLILCGERAGLYFHTLFMKMS